MTDLATCFAESVQEGQIVASDETWKAFLIGALYAGCSIIDAIDQAEGQSARAQLAAVASALICIDLETDIPCCCPVQAVA